MESTKATTGKCTWSYALPKNTWGDVEEPAYIDLDGRITTSKVAGTISAADHDNLKGELGVAVKSIASVGGDFEYVSSSTFDSSGWVVKAIKKPLRGARVNTWIVYKCLTASEYSFEVKDNVGGGVKASLNEEVAEKFGVDNASVRISSVADEPDHYRFTINNPNICLAYRAVKFTTAGKSAVNTITAGESFAPKFVLAPGEMSNERVPDIGGYDGFDKPKFYLRVVSVKGLGEADVSPSGLEICKVDRSSMGGIFVNNFVAKQPYECRVIPRNLPSGWDFTYDLDVFDVHETSKVALIKITIRAQALAGGGVNIKTANLISALYTKNYNPK
ncbi:hypothetical protein [Pseudomonas anguilliseptica]|uniref:hypothetical protein n=1 Tax=Pseudomonas anguilliseptica TaxID=53406 RepID=UPI00325B0735